MNGNRRQIHGSLTAFCAKDTAANATMMPVRNEFDLRTPFDRKETKQHNTEMPTVGDE